MMFDSTQNHKIFDISDMTIKYFQWKTSTKLQVVSLKVDFNISKWTSIFFLSSCCTGPLSSNTILALSFAKRCPSSQRCSCLLAPKVCLVESFWMCFILRGPDCADMKMNRGGLDWNLLPKWRPPVGLDSRSLCKSSSRRKHLLVFHCSKVPLSTLRILCT